MYMYMCVYIYIYIITLYYIMHIIVYHIVLDVSYCGRSSRFSKGGMQRKQGVVICMLLYPSLLFDTTVDFRNFIVLFLAETLAH